METQRQRGLVIIPTYNERENLPRIVPLVLEQDGQVGLDHVAQHVVCSGRRSAAAEAPYSARGPPSSWGGIAGGSQGLPPRTGGGVRSWGGVMRR